MIMIRLQGGIGNQMFQYALGRMLSLKNKVPLGVDLSLLLNRTPRPAKSKFTFRNYSLGVFNINLVIIPPQKIPLIHRILAGKIGLYLEYFKKKFLKIKGNEKKYTFDSAILDLGKNAYLTGYWQSPKYFAGIEDLIRKDFTLKNIPIQKIQDLAKEISSINSLCIHVRKGDYVGNKNHEVVNNEYYKNGIKKIASMTVVEKIYVFSDDIEWCKNNMSFDFPVNFVDDSYAGEFGEWHMFLMSKCRNFIIANSSFSWWGAWLSTYEKKIVVCPKQWFGDASIDTTDLIPNGWIKI